MILLELGGHAAKEIERIKFAAEHQPVSVAELAAKAEANDVSFPAHLTTIVPQGWHVGYIVEEQPPPFGTWRRLRVTLDRETPPPQEGIIHLMTAFGFECSPEACVWAPDTTVADVAAVCVMEPLGGEDKMAEFQRRMMLREQMAENGVDDAVFSASVDPGKSGVNRIDAALLDEV